MNALKQSCYVKYVQNNVNTDNIYFFNVVGVSIINDNKQ